MPEVTDAVEVPEPVGPVDPYEPVVGQPEAVTFLRRSAPAALPSYLFLGPAGSGRLAAAKAFAGDLLARLGPPGDADRHVSLAAAGAHPDVVVFERTGPYISADDARAITARSLKTPVEAAAQVLILTEFERVREAAPMLLKTIEEPPDTTHFVVIADDVPPELVTIASRCAEVPFHRVADDVVAEVVVAEGAAAGDVDAIVAAAAGDLARARMLVHDPEFVARRAAWVGALDRLDGTGSTVAVVAAELLDGIDAAASGIEHRHAAENEQLERDEEVFGARSGVRRAQAERHKRELRRHRTDEVVAGLAALGGAVRERMAAGAVPPARAERALTAIDAAGEALLHNAGERLLLHHILFTSGPEPD